MERSNAQKRIKAALISFTKYLFGLNDDEAAILVIQSVLTLAVCVVGMAVWLLFSTTASESQAPIVQETTVIDGIVYSIQHIDVMDDVLVLYRMET